MTDFVFWQKSMTFFQQQKKIFQWLIAEYVFDTHTVSTSRMVNWFCNKTFFVLMVWLLPITLEFETIVSELFWKRDILIQQHSKCPVDPSTWSTLSNLRFFNDYQLVDSVFTWWNNGFKFKLKN